MKSFARLAVAGVSGLVLFKVGTALVFPMFGMVIFLIGLTIKVALIAAIAYFVYLMLRKRTDEVEVHEVHEEVEIEVES